ncbi:MAG: hypothetical protein C0183_00105 [Roseiflexus castenholzii]|nr:MAG: hypothetical protein C0183_00105 [Roseiflexus castenholzii]
MYETHLAWSADGVAVLWHHSCRLRRQPAFHSTLRRRRRRISATPNDCTHNRTATTGSGDPPAAEKTVIIGFTASLTGKLNVESTRQTNGLKLWMDQVNQEGGLKLADGTVVRFEAKFYDDESNKDRVQELYTKLVTDDKADFLISPYSSGLADASAVIAEQYERIMITTRATSEGTYQKG